MRTFTQLTLAAAFIGLVAGQALPVQAADSCGWFAFAAATKSRSQANRLANRYGGVVWDVDYSNSPNAGQGWWTVALGPGSKSSANRWKRRFRARGARRAYIGHRCFYGE